MAEFIYPFQHLSGPFMRAYERAYHVCGCVSDVHITEWISPPTQPYASVLNIQNEEGFKQFTISPFVNTLSPEDVAHLAADPARSALWEDLMVHTALPLLRELVRVLQTKVCTNRGCISLGEAHVYYVPPGCRLVC
jgi:hypothetical protein